MTLLIEKRESETEQGALFLRKKKTYPPKKTLMPVPHLPHELWDLVMMHDAARVIQSRWIRYTLFSHTRTRDWPHLREVVSREASLLYLWRFSMVRREWRQEPESWLSEETDIPVICSEAREGLWG